MAKANPVNETNANLVGIQRLPKHIKAQDASSQRLNDPQTKNKDSG